MNQYKGNRGRERWDLIGLGSGSVSADTMTEEILTSVTLETVENS